MSSSTKTNTPRLNSATSDTSSFSRRLETGGRQGPAYAESRQRNLAWALETCLEPGIEGSDVIIAPAYGPTWKSDLIVGGHPGPASPITGPPAIAGWPILSLPMGVVDGLPVGLGIVGRADSEWTILDAARAHREAAARGESLALAALAATHEGLATYSWGGAQRRLQSQTLSTAEGMVIGHFASSDAPRPSL